MAFQLSRRQFGATLLGAAAALALPKNGNGSIFCVGELPKPESSFIASPEHMQAAKALRNYLERGLEFPLRSIGRYCLLNDDLTRKGEAPLLPAYELNEFEDRVPQIVLRTWDGENPKLEAMPALKRESDGKFLGTPFQTSWEFKIPGGLVGADHQPIGPLKESLDSVVHSIWDYENEALFTLLKAISIPAGPAKSPGLLGQVNRGFRDLENYGCEKEDEAQHCVHNLIYDVTHHERLCNDIPNHDLGDHMLWTAKTIATDHPLVKNRMYFLGAIDEVGIMAIYQDLTVLPIDNFNAVAFYDLAWIGQPGLVRHIDL